MSPPKEGHHGVIELFTGDQTSEQETCERNAAEGNMSKARRRRRLNIITKPNAPQDEERPTLSTEVHATQSIGTQDHDINEEESIQVLQIKHSNPEAMNAEWDIHSAKIILVPADGLCMYHCVHAAKDPDWMKNRNMSGMSRDNHREKKTSKKHRL